MLRLIKPCPELENAYEDFRADWKANHDKIIPAAVRGEGMNYAQLQSYLRRRESISDPVQVPATVFFLQDETRRILGAIDIRRQLNDYLLSYGGHIGYGHPSVLPRQGTGAQMLFMALPIAKELGIDRALVTCDKNNPASAKTILRCGGVLEDERLENGELVQRYWITI